jgi:hypothetical protein
MKAACEINDQNSVFAGEIFFHDSLSPVCLISTCVKWRGMEMLMQ